MSQEPSVVELGSPPWTRQELIDHLSEFASVYDNRPIKDNAGGMRSPHMFAVWFLARKLQPEVIVESGIWKGQSTWLLEQACPDAKLISIDLNLDFREYISQKAIYSNKDFSEQDWSTIPENTLAFFDDHQNALKRLQQCAWYGFRHVIFEDNYPVSQGDCYSLKKVWAGSGFQRQTSASDSKRKSLVRNILRRLVGNNEATADAGMAQYDSVSVEPNRHDAQMLKKWIEVYGEFPPIFKKAQTRWGDDWSNDAYPTSDPLLDDSDQNTYPQFFQEALDYTWICYVRLKKAV